MRLGILIVEDEAIQALALRASLEKLGHKVVGWAPNGREACKLFKEKSPDLVFLDLKLPDMNGLDAATAFNRECTTPIVILTGEPVRELGFQARLAGVCSMYSKPITLELLEVAVEHAWRTHHRLDGMEQELKDIKETLKARKTVERAKGILMSKMGLDLEEATSRLVEESNSKGLSLARVAEAVVAAGEVWEAENRGA